MIVAQEELLGRGQRNNLAPKSTTEMLIRDLLPSNHFE